MLTKKKGARLPRRSRLPDIKKTLRELMPHQKKGFRYAQKRDHPAFIMEMRLGKTLLTIRWVQNLYPPARCVLVVAPLTVLEAWENELRAEGETFIQGYGLDAAERLERVRLVNGTKRGRRWLLINYESVLATPLIAHLRWDVVIADESTKLKNPQAKITKLFLKGFRDASHRAILTGMIRPESHLEIFSQMAFLHGSFMGCQSFWKWRAAYFRPSEGDYGWEPYPEARAVIKDMVHRKCFVMSRAEAGLDKKKIYTQRTIRMTPEQQRMYNQVEKEFATTLLSGEYVDTQWQLTMQLWLTKITGGFDPENNFLSAAKKNELVELLQGELAEQKAVVWFRYRHEVEYVYNAFAEAGIPAVSILGGEPMDSRKDKIRTFRTPRYRVLLATEKVAKFGIDASVASVAIYYSNEWSNEDRGQSEERILHFLKDDSLLVIDLVCAGTVDADLADTLRDKRFESRSFQAKPETEEDKQSLFDEIRNRMIARYR